MKNRIRFISHKGKKILLVDCTNCSAEELEKFADLVPAHVTAEPRGSVLLLADFTRLEGGQEGGGAGQARAGH